MVKKKRIGIDMRMAGEGFGIGKYTLELANGLLRRQPADMEYVLFFERSFSKEIYDRFARLGVPCRLLSARYYSVQEQTILPLVLATEKLDLLHVPNFNAPLAYPGPCVVTIHDLIHHHVPGNKKKNILWRLGYRLAIRLAAARARKIIAVSATTKNDICRLLHIAPEKIRVIYEGVSEEFHTPVHPQKIEVVKKHFSIRDRYILAVGVWRRYKNLPFLAEAASYLRHRHGLDCQLVLVGEADPHYPEIKRAIIEYFKDDTGGLVITGKISFEELRALYAGASCFAAPSLFEGFGLPALEAQASGVAVAASDIPVAREILSDSALYFDPHDVGSCVEALARLLGDRTLAAAYARRGRKNAEKFTWSKTAELTETLYREILEM